MTVISRHQEMMNEMIAQGARMHVTLGEGMEAAAEEAWRTGPTAAIVRAAKSIFDTSEEIDADTANEQFGLRGTQAEIPAGTKITVDAARARAEEDLDIRMNDMIRETVNQDSPIMGRVTQFAASMAASMTDPVLLGANIAGTAVIAGGARMLAANAGKATMAGRVFNFGANVSPSGAHMLMAAYADDAARSLATVVAREGLENFAGSLIEEATIQGAMTVGDERMARKYTWQDSIQNTIAGTLMGGGLGTIMSKDGRKALADRYLMDWGDNADQYVKANTIVSSLEAHAGHEKGRLETDLMNKEVFGHRPWYPEAEAPFNPNEIPTKVFLPVDAEGKVHTVSHRGNGSVFTGSKTHAMNVGAKVIEVHTSKLKLANDEAFIRNGKTTKLGTEVGRNIAESFVNSVSPEKLSRALAMLFDPEVDLRNVTTESMKTLKGNISDLLSGKNLDEMVDLISNLKATTESTYNLHKTIEDTLDRAGYNGYTFRGKDFDGNPAYTGVYVSEKYANRARKQAEFETPKPDAGGKVRWQFEQEQMVKKHKDWVKKEARSLKEVNDIKEQMGLPKETPLEEVAAKIKQNHISEAIASSQERLSSLNKAKESLKIELEKLVADGKEIDPDLESSLAFMEEITKGTAPEKLIEADRQKWDNYVGCILGLANSVVKGAAE